MTNDLHLTVDVRDDRPELLKIELGLLVLLMATAVFLTHAFIHNYVKASAPQVVQSVANLTPAAKFSLIGQSSQSPIGKQSTRMFVSDQWVVEEQVFVQNTEANGWVEWTVPGLTPGKKQVTIYMTRSTDYGIVQVSINDKLAGTPIDLYSPAVGPLAGVDLGIVEVTGNTLKLKVAVVNKNNLASSPYYQFGVQGIALAPRH